PRHAGSSTIDAASRARLRMGATVGPTARAANSGIVGGALPARGSVGIIRAVRRGTISGEGMRRAGPTPRRGGFLDGERMGPFATPEEVTMQWARACTSGTF